MGIYEKQVSKRLERFLDNHLEYEDIGGPESGPKLSCSYGGPEWAMRLWEIGNNVKEYLFYVEYSNHFWTEEYDNAIWESNLEASV